MESKSHVVWRHDWQVKKFLVVFWVVMSLICLWGLSGNVGKSHVVVDPVSKAIVGEAVWSWGDMLGGFLVPWIVFTVVMVLLCCMQDKRIVLSKKKVNK